MKCLKTVLCAALISVLPLMSISAAESGYLKAVDTESASAQFERGTYSPLWQVTSAIRTTDTSFYNSEFTKMIMLTSGSGNSEYGSTELVNRCRRPGGALETIGLSNETLDNVELTFKLKLDDVRNKNLSISFSAVLGSNGQYTLNGDYGNGMTRRDFVNSMGERFIPIGEYVAATTEWQTVTVPLNLTDYTRIKYWNSSYTNIFAPADWSYASAVHISLLKKDSAIVDRDNPATTTEISYGDITLDYSKLLKCKAEIKMKNMSGSEITSLRAGESVISEVNIVNETTQTPSVLLMQAVYKDGIMIKLTPKFVSIAADGPTNFGFDPYVLPTDVTGMEMNTYLWTDFANMQPISKHISAN